MKNWQTGKGIRFHPLGGLSGVFLLFLLLAGVVAMANIGLVPAFAETTPPVMEMAEGASKNTVKVIFSESLDQTTAEAAYNYSISPELAVFGATLQSDGRTVLLDTGSQTDGTTYTLTVSNVRDLSGNTIAPGSAVTFRGFRPHGLFLKDTGMCKYCHRTHNAVGSNLTNTNTNRTLCYVCHDQGGQSSLKVADDFAMASNHKVNDGVLTCVDCHNPHGDKKDGDNLYPRLLRSTVGESVYNSGPEYCLACHGDQTYPNGSHNDVNRPVLLPASGTKVTCVICHAPMGSNYSRLLWEPEEDLCLNCHTDPANSRSGLNLATVFGQAYSHPTLTVDGKHNDTEDYNNLALADRHAECADCHNPHGASSSAALANIKGVQVTNNSSQRPEWSSLPYDSSGYTLTANITKEYELCYKCHSSYSFGNNPPEGAWDIARDFNPNNPSYHPVEAVGKNTFDDVYDYSASLINGWTPTSVMACSDCHGDSNSQARGVHGSAIKGILKAPYQNDNSDLCFLCHDQATYLDGSNDYTGFYNAIQGNLHSLHRAQNYGCKTCHVAVPHGSQRERLIAFQGDTLAGPEIKLNSWTKNTSAYVYSDCTTALGCHN